MGTVCTMNFARCGACGVPARQPHDPRCPAPAVAVEARPDLWTVKGNVDDDPADRRLEEINRRALAAWFRAGRTI